MVFCHRCHSIFIYMQFVNSIGCPIVILFKSISSPEMVSKSLVPQITWQSMSLTMSVYGPVSSFLCRLQLGEKLLVHRVSIFFALSIRKYSHYYLPSASSGTFQFFIITLINNL